MFDIELYTAALTSLLKEAYGDRLLFAGLQGSFARGEANESSDVDIMTVIDGITPADLDIYREALKKAGGEREACGFICGGEELKSWNPLEICQLTHETKPLYGELAPLCPVYCEADVRAYVKLLAGNMLHELCHRYIYRGRERSAEALPSVCKQTLYILQNLHWLRGGDYINSRAELINALDGGDKAAAELSERLRNGEAFDFDTAYRTLFDWCREVIINA